MEIKGSALASVPEFVKTKFGKEGFRTWLHAIGEEARDIYAYPVNLNSWYPLLPILSGPTRHICEIFYQNDIAGAREAGRFSADFALHGIYKLFVKLGSVESLIKRASLILPTYYRPSAIRVTENRKNGVNLQIFQFDEMDEIIESRISGWIQRAVEISGVESAEVVTSQSLTRGDAVTEFSITWK